MSEEKSTCIQLFWVPVIFFYIKCWYLIFFCLECKFSWAETLTSHLCSTINFFFNWFSGQYHLIKRENIFFYLKYHPVIELNSGDKWVNSFWQYFLKKKKKKLNLFSIGKVLVSTNIKIKLRLWFKKRDMKKIFTPFLL